MTDANADDLLTVREAAGVLGVSVDHVRKLCYADAIENTLDERDHNYRLRRDAVEAYRDGRSTGDLHPMFTALGELADEIVAAKKTYDDLIEKRERDMVAWVKAGQSVTAVAVAAKISRDRATKILKVARKGASPPKS